MPLRRTSPASSPTPMTPGRAADPRPGRAPVRRRPGVLRRWARSVAALWILGVPAALLVAAGADAQGLPCSPCAGIRVPDAAAAAELAGSLAAARDGLVPVEDTAAAGEGEEDGTPEAPLLVAWSVDAAALAGDPEATANSAAASRGAAAAVRRVGGTPWITFRFRTAVPILDHVATLDGEIAAASAVVRAVAPVAGDAWYQLDWHPVAGVDEAGRATPAEVQPAEYAYLAKRAAVAVSGAAPAARVASRPLPADPDRLDALFAEEMAGYLDAVALAFAPPGQLESAAAAVARLDPGSPVILDAAPFPPLPARGLGLAAEYAVAGVQVTLFDTTPRAGAHRGTVPLPDPAGLAPFLVLARENAGDVAYDPTSTPPGGTAWSFVRGSDLGLRVIVLPPRRGDGQAFGEVVLTFPDPQLRNPRRVDLATGAVEDLYGLRVSGGVEVRLEDPGSAALLRLERIGVEELGEGALAEEVTVESERQIPVEEILRRLQAFEDAQERRIDHYAALNTTHLRFGVGAGSVGSFEATFEGPFFFDEEEGIDWAWETLYVNGVRWRGKSIPEIPLVQPEKAAALPGEITFDKTYRYRLRGTEVVDGRDTWVVEFEPAVPVRGGGGPAAGSGGEDGAEAGPDDAAGAVSLYRGTVWIDRQVHARVRTRAVQLGLQGEVLSNEETLHYQPVDAAGAAIPWDDPGAFVLPLHLVAQQLLSVVNATTLVERETRLSAVRINGDDFADRRAQVLASDVTMVRDTEEGLRYLVKAEDGEGRVVKEGYDTSKWFIVGGVFWDDSLDYPLPLGGVNYLDLDFRDTDTQLNVFFAGALLAVNAAQPRLFDSRFDAGIDLFGIAVPLSDSVYRDGREIEGEEVEMRPLTTAVKLGRPLGSFVKLGAEYRLRSRDYGATDETAEGFAVPSDHLEHEFELSARFTRFGYSLTTEGAYASRSEWEPWGFAGNPEYDPDHEDYMTWRATLAKSWYLRRFQKIGAELVYVDGDDLDRFSKYEFGFFGDTRVAGYRSSRVKAERAYLARASYGFEIGQLLRLDAQVDTAWATDEVAGLDNEFLAGIGVAGTFVGPWQTLINLDVGTPLAGPDDGVVAYVVFLKLFD